VVLFIANFAGQVLFRALTGVSHRQFSAGNALHSRKKLADEAIIASAFPSSEVLAHTAVTLFGRRTIGVARTLDLGLRTSASDSGNDLLILRGGGLTSEV